MAGIWPRLKKTVTCDHEVSGRKKKSSSKSKKVRLEKFVALLMKGVQSKKTSSLVERTGASVTAARSLSRSAQGWTASSLARTATRRADVVEAAGRKSSPDIVFLHCAVRRPSDAAQTRSSDHTECAEPGVFNYLRCVEVESKFQDSQSENVCEVEAHVAWSLDGILSEDRKSQPGDNSDDQTMAGLCVALPVKKTGRGMKRTALNSAFVVLVALGAFISSRFGKVGNGPLAVVLALINAAVRVWRRGKLYVWLMFSSVAVHFSTPLRLYLTYCPRRFSLLPRKVKVTACARSLLPASEVSKSLEIGLALPEGGGSRLQIPVLPLESAPAAATKQGHGAPLSLLLAIPESSAETPASSAIEPVPATVLFKDGGASSPSRRLAKKFSSGFKKFNMMRSPSSSSPSGSLLSGSEGSLSSPSLSGRHNFTGASEPGSPTSPSLHSPAASSPERHRKRPFSRRLHKPKPNTPSELAKVHGDDAAVTVHATEKKPGGKKSSLCRKSSTETLDIGEITLSANDTTPMSSRPVAAQPETTDTSRNVSWPVVGLLVTLLFLLVGRLPAIMATSLFLVVVTNAHHDRAHPRSRGRSSEVARKLHRSPPPRRHPGSPPRRY